uniref:G-protein coupled receptors family 1 profile domain-containing protein n=1 Tax=Erpetoichthys calabaricus TaxID=27687 RepID=A0A8C4RM65_ERPCA
MELTEVQELQKVQYCFHYGNISCPKEVRPVAVYIILYVFAAASVMLTIFGNLVVIISISHFKQLHTPTNLLVLSLAVADFLVGLIVMPFTIIQSIETCWYFGDIFCYLHSVFYLVLTSASISSLVFIAIDRYFAVCYPFLYTAKITIPVTWGVIGLSWFLSVFYTWAILYFRGNADVDPCPGDCVFVLNLTWGTTDLVCSFIMPVSLMVTLYTKIIIIAKRHAKAISVQQRVQLHNNMPPLKKSEAKASKTLGIVVLVFLLCWLPFYICTILNQFISYPVPSFVFCACLWLAFLNSGINPIIYALFYPWFRKSFRFLVTFKICSHGSSLFKLLNES